MTAASAADVLAHGLGGSSDLPVPYAYAVVGAAWALTFTFALVAFAWRRPRFDPFAPGRPLPAVITAVMDARITRASAAGAALVFAVWVVLAGLWARRRRTTPCSERSTCCCGSDWSRCHCFSDRCGGYFRPCGRFTCCFCASPAAAASSTTVLPGKLGISPGRSRPVRVRVDGVGQSQLGVTSRGRDVAAGLRGGVAGRSVGVRAALAGRVDPFAVYSMAVSRLSPFRRNSVSGQIVVGNPLDHLPSLPVRPGVVAMLAVLLGSTAFDSYSASPTWRNFADRLSRAAGAVPTAVSSSVLRSVGLLVFIAVVALTFSLAARATGGVDREQRRALPGQMAHSLIPIVVGYIFAHYLSYLVERGQQALFALADPLARAGTCSVWRSCMSPMCCPCTRRCWPGSRWPAS
ncbi:hypothetical protein I552_5904 [Mycobacterium xenopi 3993]|nr:hypothetical protein I552_5904 [Mycobacterium xenopi 3993]